MLFNSFMRKNLLIQILVTAALTIFSQTLFSQADKKIVNIETEQKSEPTASYFRFNASYISNSVYLGRRDSLTLPYFTPSLTYYNKSGFNASLSLGYLNSSTEKRVDYFSVDLGYDFKIAEKLSASIYANKIFNNDNSSRVNGDIKGTLGTSLNYDLDAIQWSAGMSAMFDNKTDILIFSSINHPFYFGEDDKQWTISPLALVNFSTLHFYEGYTSRDFGKRNFGSGPSIASATATTTVNNNKLTLMNYEFSLPISYDSRNFGVYLTPTYSIPQNAIKTQTTLDITYKNGTKTSNTFNSTPYSERNLSNNFYVEAGVYFNF